MAEPQIHIRKRSPRAPLVSLKESVDRVSKIYDAEGKHPASADIVSQHIGYKSSGNGAAKQALAALGYYGLLERQPGGMLAVSKSFEEYKFAPTEELRAKILKKWLQTPDVFGELLEKFQERLPSEASLKYELINKGFNPSTADECLVAFMESVQYVKNSSPTNISNQDIKLDNTENDALTESTVDDVSQRNANSARIINEPVLNTVDENNSDKIPVRLANGRRAWLVIPTPFYEADKRRLISQIELLLTDDEE